MMSYIKETMAGQNREAFTSSVTELINKICKLQLIENQRRAYIIQPKLSRDHHCQQLKKKAYDILFDFLKGRTRYTDSSINPVSKEVDGILSYAYYLRSRRKFDEANRLENQLQSLLSKDGEGDSDDLHNILLFLVLLAGSRKDGEQGVLGHSKQKLPKLPFDQICNAVFPNGPVCYGDSQFLKPDDHYYMHYPRELFEASYQQSDIRKESDTQNLNIFGLTPGTGLSGNGLFNLRPLLNDSHEKEARATLFGALVQGRVTSLDVKLDIPDLPDDLEIGGPELQIPKAYSSSQISEDEGFKSDISSSVLTLDDSAVEEDIWEQALTYIPNKHYTWEWRGCEPGPTERPFLTEAGPEAVDHWYSMKMMELSLMCPDVTHPPRVPLSQPTLKEDIINLLIGVPSNTFALYQDDQEFSQRLGVYVTGMTPEALHSFLNEFVECGTNYYRLSVFSKAPVLDSFYDAGLVFQAFTGAVRKVLQYYRAVVLTVPKTVTIMELKLKFSRIFAQIRYLANLCRCDFRLSNVNERDNNAAFLTGINLLTYIYKETVEANNTDNYPMMLSILQTTCGPYTLFVQDWVFHGTFRDVYGEFAIHVNQEYLEFRDKHYWTHGYTLTAKNMEENVPLFLADMASDIFICGKAINLLKLCCPQHFVCKVTDPDFPQVTITFSEEELRTIDVRCQIYVNKMKQIARQLTLSRKAMKEKAEQAKRDLMEKASHVAAQQLARLQAIIDERKKAVDVKKRKEFSRLKTQMVTDLQRRAEEKEQSKAEDKKYIAKITRQEEAIAEEELELEKQAREEVIAYYAELSEEAAWREQKALWKIRRGRLEQLRVDFLMAEEDKWKKEMEESTEAQAVLERDSESKLPVWAKRIIDDPTAEPVIASEQEPDDYALPNWAERRLAEPPAAVFGIDTKTDKDMPNWAQKGFSRYGSDDHPLVVEGEEALEETLPSVFADTLKFSKVKTGLKMNESVSASLETEQKPEKLHVQMSSEMSSTKETETDDEIRPQIKMFGGMHATKEMEPDEDYKPHVKFSEDMHATKETESSDIDKKPHLKMVGEIHANVESSPGEDIIMPRLKRQDNQHANVESIPTEWKIKKANVFGHVSKLSALEYEIPAPRLKKRDEIYANLESDPKDFAIRPRIKMSNKMSSVTESAPDEPAKPKIKMKMDMYATKESQFVDMDEVRLQKFKVRNVHGHSSDSTVQRLLYGEMFGLPSKDDKEVKASSSEILKPLPNSNRPDSMWLDGSMVEQYTDNYDFLNLPPAVDLMAARPTLMSGSWGDYGISTSRDVDAYKYMPLPALLYKSMTAPLQAQISLVNSNLITYFFSELKIEEHFEALRKYLLMSDGDFAQIVSDILLEKLAANPLPQEMLNPVFLNGTLTKSLQSSMHSDDKYADNLSFALKYIPAVFQPNAHDTLDCLELRYKVDWPVNIVLTENCMTKYSKVFSFMLQLRRIVWVLKDVWHRLKRDAIVNKAGNAPQFRQLQLHRQEMQHFVKVMQGYIANQIIHVTWKEFLEALTQDVHNLDDLHRVHAQYLEKAIFRSLLNKKAAPVMKIIQDIFCLILKFRTQLVSSHWIEKQTGEIIHANFSNMVASYKAFREYSVFLFNVVNKLSIRGYQPHLQELLLRLNFNSYYKEG